MFRICKYLVISAVVILISTPLHAQDQLGRIYGKITLRDGDVYEGRISWGEHETAWIHTFDASYNHYDYHRDLYRKMRREGRKISRSGNVSISFMFGYMVSLERKGSKAIVNLKDGREYELSGEDVADSVVLFDKDLGEMKIEWREMEMIEFMDEPADYSEFTDENAYPLFGKVSTRAGLDFTGFMLYDNDESLSTDILDGEDRKRDIKIPFGKIRSIEPFSRRGSEITLWTGRKFELTGSNDVNDENRGIVITDRKYGVVEIEYSDIDLIEFEQRVSGMKYSDFKRPEPLYGTLTDDRGDEFTGFIKWDYDESFSSDYLNGNYRDLKLKIEFANIIEIKRRTRNSALVKLKNGTEILMRESNDVNYQNKGILVLKKADDVEGDIFYWDEFEKVVFKKR